MDSTPPIVTPFYLDKGLWLVVLAPVIAVLNQRFGLALDPAVIIGLLLPVAAYVVMHKWKTATLQSQAMAAAAGKAAAAQPGPGAIGS